MLPAHIIEQILKQEKLTKADVRPQLTLDLPLPFVYEEGGLEPTDRGVVVIDLFE